MIQTTLPHRSNRITLCLTQTVVVKQIEIRYAWSLILEHYLKLMTLCRHEGEGIGLEVGPPVLLLRLNRDDSAYCYCRRAIGSMDWTDMDLTFTNDTELAFPGRHGRCRW